MIENKYDYDLEERTAKLGEEIIDFCKELNKDVISIPLIKQIIRSATSVGANYCEANAASSKRDFKNKIYLCKKELNETKFWLRMIVRNNPEAKEKARTLWKEVQELVFIFSKIISSLKENKL